MSWMEIANRRLRKGSAYKECFNGQGGKLTDSGSIVMEDLARFCYGTKTTAIATSNGIDPIASAQAEGRRQVYLRIMAHLHMSDSAILESIARNSDHE